MLNQQKLRFSTTGRGTYNITSQISEAIEKSGIKSGICHIFIQHTSASLILCENADRSVREDLDTFMAKLVKDGDSMYKHKDEIEAKFDGVITWQRLDNKRASRIKHEMPVDQFKAIPGKYKEKTNWQAWIDWYRVKMVEFYDVLYPILEKES